MASGEAHRGNSVQELASGRPGAQAPGYLGEAAPAQMIEELAGRSMTGPVRALFAAVAMATTFLVLNQLLNFQLFAGVVFIENRYLYILAGLVFPLVFLVLPANPKNSAGPTPWYDWALAALSAALFAWFAVQATRILSEGWEYNAPTLAKVLAGALWLLVMEGLRRTSGWPMAIIVAVVSLYPVVAESIPNPLKGSSQSLPDTLAFHFASAESALGIPMRAFAEIVVGFIIFGVALNYTGGGRFFNDLAFAMVGRFRGGAAQVGIISSALQGSISGSVISNVVSSGVVTIPAMKRTGFRSDYAGAVEAVASTGAVLMPPVMGSTAFVMASFLGRSYGEIALAATVPALLLYVALVVQIDGYSAVRGIKGMRASELPRLGAVMREGWFYLPVFVLLVFLMVSLQDEAVAPFYATALLLAINQALPRHRMSLTKLMDCAAAVARALAELVAVLLAIGTIIGALSMTGLAGTLANDLVYLAGGAPLVLLVTGALTSFVFGIGMTVTACYIFLAIVLAPPLIKAGLDPLAVHLFIMYWGMVSFITPPVALATFAAAPLAGVSAMRIGFQAVKLGFAIYVVPFCFVLNPALILKGSAGEIAGSVALAFPGVIIIAGAMQGYIAGLGPIPKDPLGWTTRAALVAGGFLLAAPRPRLTGLSIGLNVALAAVLVLVGLMLVWAHNTKTRRKPA